jgi:glutamate decarboxylase
MVPAYTLPPDADHIKMMRVLVKETLGRSMTTALGADLAQACATLEQKGQMHHTERKRVHTSTGY